MKYMKIPKTDIKISKIGFGTRQLKIKENKSELIKLIDKSLDLGINFFCTSSNYQEGRVEAKLGELLSGIRDEVIIATSGGVSNYGGRITIDSSRDALEKSIQQSLKNLQTDYLDHFELHFLDPITPLEEPLSFLLNLLETDVIKSVGTSCFKSAVLRKWEDLIPTSLVQVPLNPLQRRAYQSVLETCQQLDIGILTYSPYFGGLLTKKLDEFPSYLNEMFTSPENWQSCLLKLTHDLARLSRETDKTIPQLVLNWILSHHELTTVLIGTNTINHLIENELIVNHPLSSSIIRRIDQIINFHFPLSESESLNNKPKFEAIIESILTNSKGERVAIFKSGLKFVIPQQYEVGTKLYLDIETGDIIN